MFSKTITSSPVSTATAMQVMQTDNYDMFKFMVGNRAINPTKVNQLMTEIRQNGLQIPIVVNEKYEVADGQHRLDACRELGVPVMYIVRKGITIEDAANANTAGSNWTTIDWINYHASQGKEEYKKLQQWIEVCRGEGLTSLNVTVFFAQNTLTNERFCMYSDGVVRSNASKLPEGVKMLHKVGSAMRLGHWKFGDMDMAYKLLHTYLDFRDTAKWAGKQNFVSALVKVSRIKAFDSKWLLKQVEAYPQMWHNCPTSDLFLDMIENIYNYRKNHRNRLPIKNNPELYL